MRIYIIRSELGVRVAGVIKGSKTSHLSSLILGSGAGGRGAFAQAIIEPEGAVREDDRPGDADLPNPGQPGEVRPSLPLIRLLT
jgi:hypothetical protein